MTKDTIKWIGSNVKQYYDSHYLNSKINLKFYNSFNKKGTDYKLGDYAIINKSEEQKFQQIGRFKCFFQEGVEKKAIVDLYLIASEFKEELSKLNIPYDQYNEVILDTIAVINLRCVVKACVIIFDVHDNEKFDFDSRSRETDYLCRFEHTGNRKLVPILNEDIKNDITVIEDPGFESNSSDKTPLKKMENSEKPCFKKNSYESMEIDGIQIHHLKHVKRNLNHSFNDSLSETEQFPHYSIVEDTNDGSLKIKLRASNGKILSKLPPTQPIVCLHQIESVVPKSEENLIYELKSPIFQTIIAQNNKQKSKINQLKQVESLSSMVDDLKITSEPSVKVSPRKLRKHSTSYYRENFSDSDTENEPIRRKRSTRPKFDSDTNLKNNQGVRRSCRRTTRLISYRDFDSDDNSVIDKGTRQSLRKNYHQMNSANFISERETYKTDINNSLTKISNSENEIFYEEIETVSDENSQECCDNLMTQEKGEGAFKKNRNIEMEVEEKPGRRALRQLSDAVIEEHTLPNIPDNNSIEKNRSIDHKIGLNTRKRNKSHSFMETPKKSKSTPLKLMRDGVLTPSIDPRKRCVVKTNTPLVLARNNLHVSYVPKILPCREREYTDIHNFIKGKLMEKCGGCMYISGVPGTGKTATVTAAIENIIRDWDDEGYSKFNYVNINGMRLTEPRQCYVEILKQLMGKRIPWEQALSALEQKFCTKSCKNIVSTVLLVDELDILCTKRQDVVYNLLDWPTKSNAQLIVVTIANTMDLPERLLISRVTSRLGLTRLTFQAYTHKQLQEIVTDRLTGNNSFKADAIQFVARKVASVSGDARRALDICRRSAEIAEMEGPNTQVSMNHVNAALEAMITQPKVKAIAHCSKLEKLLLQSIIAEIERTGIEETSFGDVYNMLPSLAVLEGFKMVSASVAASAIYRLSCCRLILIDHKCVDFNQRIILNVSSDDVYYALKNEE